MADRAITSSHHRNGASTIEEWFVEINRVTVIESSDAVGTRMEGIAPTSHVARDTVMARLMGVPTERATWDSIQVGKDLHVRTTTAGKTTHTSSSSLLPDKAGGGVIYLNHRYDPNTRMRVLGGPTSRSMLMSTSQAPVTMTTRVTVEIVAATDIAMGSLLYFNCNTTEWRMDEPFRDWQTGRWVQGYSMSSTEERNYLLKRGLVAEHILKLLDKEEATTEASTSKSTAT